jgi:intermediate cleaving peptidase 55
LYLTGLNEPDAALVIDKDQASRARFTLFVKPKSKSSIIWDGHKTGLDEAIHYFEADESRPIQELPSYLESLTETSKQIFTDLNLGLTKSTAKPLEEWPIQTNSGHATDSTSSRWSLPKEIRSNYQTYLSGFFSKESFQPIKKISPIIQSLRHQKSAAELRVMRESGRISGRAFAKTMSQTKPGLTEHQISAMLNYEVSMRGASSLAYVPVVAGGANALTLHYVRNDDILKDGDLLLVDAGGVRIILWVKFQHTLIVKCKYSSMGIIAVILLEYGRSMESLLSHKRPSTKLSWESKKRLSKNARKKQMFL